MSGKKGSEQHLFFCTFMEENRPIRKERACCFMLFNKNDSTKIAINMNCFAHCTHSKCKWIAHCKLNQTKKKTTITYKCTHSQFISENGKLNAKYGSTMMPWRKVKYSTCMCCVYNNFKNNRCDDCYYLRIQFKLSLFPTHNTHKI